ncbi:MAG: VTT domain-containing protein [Spirochaetaceae bacterium]|jgi:membrane protein DedA with SNARE-associated domain|nr:VTT domain-containing protein [Spirochaetaceae bacterium]
MAFFDAISQYIHFYPLAAFICLFVAGFCLPLPISEDLLIVAGSQVCRSDHSLLVPSLIALYVGIVVSDHIAFLMGHLIRLGVLKVNFLHKILERKSAQTVHRYLEKYGILTFIVCRFIPFGVRNILFLTSGVINLELKRFTLYDIPAAFISMNTLFFISFFLGKQIAG